MFLEGETASMRMRATVKAKIREGEHTEESIPTHFTTQKTYNSLCQARLTPAVRKSTWFLTLVTGTNIN